MVYLQIIMVFVHWKCRVNEKRTYCRECVLLSEPGDVRSLSMMSALLSGNWAAAPIELAWYEVVVVVVVVDKIGAIVAMGGWWFSWFWDCAGEAEGLLGWWESEIKRYAGNSPVFFNFPALPFHTRTREKRELWLIYG